MAQEIERLQHEEQLSTLEKKQRAAALMAEVAAANAQQIERKKQLAEQEKEEEACIAEYIRQKDAGEQVRLPVYCTLPLVSLQRRGCLVSIMHDTKQLPQCMHMARPKVLTIEWLCAALCVQALAAEKAAAAHEREMEVARLRALQEKVQDTRSAEDELRAKRYQVRSATWRVQLLTSVGCLALWA